VTYENDYESEMTDQTSTSAHGADRDYSAGELMLSSDGTGGTGGDLAALLAELQQLANGPAPTPTEELAALLSQGLPGIKAAQRRSRRRKIVAGVVLGGVASFGLTGVAAANDRLPGGARDVVSRVVNDLTPFHIAEKRTPTLSVPAPTRTHPSAVPTPPSAAAAPVPGVSGSGGSDDQGGVGSGGSDDQGGSGPGSADDGSTPTPRPSETSGDGDDKGGASGSDREPSDPPVTPHPTKTTGDSPSDGSGGSGSGHDGDGGHSSD
jgi:hypothetical protein